MSRQHTKGPWAAVEVGQGGPADNPMPVYEIQSADGYAVIAEYVDDWNAPLLAAAPELLEALRLLHDNLAEYQRINNLGGYDNHDMRMARAAIAKATGGPQ